MKLSQITEYSGRLLKGNRAKSTLICLMPLGVSLFFRLAEATLFCVMLYFDVLTPVGLFTAESPVHLLSAIVSTVLRWLATAPLYYAAAYWHIELCSDEKKHRRKIPTSRIILNRKIYGRSLGGLLLSKAVGLIFIIPTVFFGKTALMLISESSANPTDSLQLFLAVHASVLTLLSVGLWIWSKLALVTVPYLLVKLPDRSAARVVYDSFAFMSKRRGTLIKIAARYLLPMIFPLTIPFMLAGAFTSTSLFVSISLKEDEYFERNQIYCRNGQARNSSKLSAWTKRCFAPSADEAKAAGYGDNP